MVANSAAAWYSLIRVFQQATVTTKISKGVLYISHISISVRQAYTSMWIRAAHEQFESRACRDVAAMACQARQLAAA